MKKKLIIILFLISHFTYGQFGTYINSIDSLSHQEFQVLEARNTYSGGIKVNRLATLYKNEFVEVREGGFLSIVHFSGKGFEFNDSTTIHLDTLDVSLDGRVFPSLDLSMLFNLTKFQNNWGATLASAPPFEFISPFDKQLTASRNQVLCLQWRWVYNIEHDNFMITFKNIYNESILDTIRVKGYGYNVDFNLVKELKLEFNVLVIQLHENKTSSEWKHEIYVELGDKYYNQPISLCRIRNATEAIMAGAFSESFHLFPNDAMIYYQMAVDLSDEEVFKIILKHAKLRLVNNK
jgi:hypothetical protein